MAKCGGCGKDVVGKLKYTRRVGFVCDECFEKYKEKGWDY